MSGQTKGDSVIQDEEYTQTYLSDAVPIICVPFICVATGIQTACV